MDERIKRYWERLDKEARAAYDYANKAKRGSFDPEENVEIALAKDLAERIEGLLGIEGLKDTIRELEKTGMPREKLAFEITKRIARGELLGIQDVEKRIDLAVRVGTAILTEGVLVAPTEGISKVVIKKDGGQPYVSIYYAGPIRSAGGTVAAVTALLADLARRENNIPPYKPTREEVLRVIEEVNLYDSRVARLQYKPPDEDVETIYKNIPVELNGDPTADVEVMSTRDLPRIETNRVRGGVPLVIGEGIAQKAKKLKKYVKELGIDGWEFLWELKGIKQEIGDKGAVDAAYLDGLVAGRPVISYPGAKGGFRLRYGRSMTNGLMAKNIHPTAMYLLDSFIANGTHVKLEKPGKGAIITSNDSLHPPVVRLKNGDVVYDPKDVSQVEKVLFLGDILSTYGDFLKSNNPLVPSPYVEEWWRLEAQEEKDPETLEEALRISKEKNVPLHPKYIYFWKNITNQQLDQLIQYLEKAKIEEDRILVDKEAKEILEEILVPHKVTPEGLLIEGEWAKMLLANMGYDGSFEKLKQAQGEILERLSKAAGVEIRDKVGVFIGVRMGRPEKAKPRTMEASPSVLFPTGSTVRDLLKHKEVSVEISHFLCECGNITIYPKCELCGKRTTFQGAKTRILPIQEMVQKLKEKYGSISELKGVRGLISKEKIPEYLEKGYFRAKYGLPVNKDGTMRFDAINITLTHFRPKDIGVSVEKLKELGYEVDYEGKPLERDDQIVPLYPQDIVIPESALDYLFRAAKAIDDMLVNIYGMDPYYNVEKKEDMIGKLVITQSPHTSAGIVARIIGYTDIKGIFGHPFLHTAKRRNVDGDEDSIFLLMDGFLNFSKHYLGASRGGTMDAPIVLIININPKEVDDEVYTMEVEPYSLEFYKATLEEKPPGEVKIDTVGNHLEDFPYFLFNLTHPQSSILIGPKETTYVKLKSMVEKVEREAAMMAKLKSVDVRDAIARIINDHFIPDIYGNLRKFSRQEFRCKKCNTKFRRVPLIGKCTKCGGDLILTIHKGGIEKYLHIAIELAEKYNLPKYVRARLELVKIELKHMFGEEKQSGLQDFV
ncbi:MAG: DNA polymerase II large subunit [Candidatus Micrarchaeota archaeon]|nr:DNA polymerase II large subunit [Candidatus Micrarchaeota archaeon]